MEYLGAEFHCRGRQLVSAYYGSVLVSRKLGLSFSISFVLCSKRVLYSAGRFWIQLTYCLLLNLSLFAFEYQSVSYICIKKILSLKSTRKLAMGRIHIVFRIIKAYFHISTKGPFWHIPRRPPLAVFFWKTIYPGEGCFCLRRNVGYVLNICKSNIVFGGWGEEKEAPS